VRQIVLFFIITVVASQLQNTSKQLPERRNTLRQETIGRKATTTLFALNNFIK